MESKQPVKYNFSKNQYPHLSKWYFDHIISGDTRHPFLAILKETMNPKEMVKFVNRMSTILFQGFEDKNMYWMKTVYYCSPWPGFVKYYTRTGVDAGLDDELSYSISEKELEQAYMADGGTRKNLTSGEEEEEEEEED